MGLIRSFLYLCFAEIAISAVRWLVCLGFSPSREVSPVINGELYEHSAILSPHPFKHSPPL